MLYYESVCDIHMINQLHMCDIHWNLIFHYMQAALPHAGGLQRFIGRLIITIYASS